MNGGESHGDCKGLKVRNTKWIPSGGHELTLKIENALISCKLKVMLSGPGKFIENKTNEVNFRESFTCTIERCIYFTYKVCYTNSSIKIPELPGK